MTELKPCPFCGRKAEMDALVACGEDGTKYVISCPKCEISVSSYSEDDAYNIWNRRANRWHTGTPSEDGLYAIAIHPWGRKENGITYICAKWDNGNWRDVVEDCYCEPYLVAWQKLDEYKEGDA